MASINPLVQTDNGDVSYQKINSNEANLNSDKADTGGTNITDNRLIKGNGGTNGVQETGITVDDSNNVTGVADLTASSLTVSDYGDINATGTITQTHTATADNDDTITQNIDMAGYSSISAIQSNISTGATSAGDSSAVYNISIDNTGSTGGSIAGMFINQVGTGTSSSSGLFTGEGLSLVGQFAPSLGTIDEGLVNGVDTTSDFNTIGITTNVFVNNGDTVTIGEAATFEQIEIIIGAGASFDGVQPTFEYSTGVGTWTAFAPGSDTTNGFQLSGLITWDADALSGWATGTGGNYLIRITRTEAALTTTPTVNRIRTGTQTIYNWDSEGLITTKQVDAEFLIDAVNGSPVKSLNSSHQLFGSTGNISGGYEYISDLGDGTVSIIGGGGWIRSSDSINATLYGCTWGTTTLSGLTDNALNYIYLDFVDTATNPTPSASTSQSTDYNTKILLGTVYKSGTDLEINNQLGFNTQSTASQIIRRLQGVEPFSRATGGVASESGTRNIAVTAGTWWEGLNDFGTSAFDSSSTDTFKYLYSDGAGGWTTVDATVGTEVFTGVGLDDATSSGTYTGTGTETVKVEIDATGTPDTFKWFLDGAEQASGVAITGAAQTLIHGITITFGATTGHTVGDYWEITATNSTTINNTQYDDGSGTLASLTGSRYGLHWIYLDTHGHITILFGTGNYTLSQAEAASVPSSVPASFDKNYRLIARAIVQNGGTNLYAVETVFEETFGTAAATNHNDLSGIQGGTAGEYYHLTSTEYTNNVTSPSSSVTDNSVPRFDSTTGKIIQDANDAIVINDDDSVVFNSTSNTIPFQGANITSNHALNSDNTHTGDFSSIRVDDSAGTNSVFAIGKARGTVGSEAALADTNAISTLVFAGYDGSHYYPAASINTKVDGVVSTGVMPGELGFNTTDGTGTAIERMVIKSDGNVGIGVDPNAKLTVEGVISLDETTAPSATAGYGKIYVKSSDSNLYFMDDAGTETQLNSAGGGASNAPLFGANVGGTQIVQELYYYTCNTTITAGTFRASLGTLCTGADFIIKLYKNGVEDASITIATTDSATNGRYQGTDTTFVSGSYVANDVLTVEVTQVGSSVAGADLEFALYE